ncbi:hypothetical protein P171DRAFT_433614 [Karstenula rhodostoma CBS 690.94]|uniref:Transcription initiation factor IIF subunit beta n=1 Tax=Karstenula rhodostoma CBS 690.94 TaxID=1392251 RepID=A0A9P4PBM5_9PLEO|nr:hypothetical protein P171DRAFT_433614 [Karstenula rhodostoma CBS 690.94]
MMKTEGASPSFGGGGYMDDEFYEDTGELSLPRVGEKHVMIARIPDWLYDHVSKWDELAKGGNDHDLIEIGEVLSLPAGNAYDQNKAQKDSKDGKKPLVKREGPPEPPSMRIFFNNDWHVKTGLPTAFEIEGQTVNDTLLNNTYVFTEKDLPGYKHNGVGQPKPNGAVQDPKARITKRPKYKKAIPKQTSLIGSVNTQYLAKPLNTAEFIAFNTQRTKEAIQGRNSRTNIMTETVDEVTVMNNLQDSFTSFIRSDKKPKSQQNKFARLPRNELIDILHRAFDEHRYWPMKQLKQHTKQPEAYLKEVLPEIAHLIKSGNFASLWTRLNMFQRVSLHDGIADIGIEDEEDDEEMEDVV